jgi:uncharacterized protein (DUF885 family)
MFRSRSFCALLVFALGPALAGCGKSPAEQFSALADEFIQGYFAARPVTATSIGAHAFDREMDDMSREAVSRELDRLRLFRERIGSFPAARLSRDDRIDLEILRDRIDLEILEIAEVKSWKNDPLVYTSLIGNGIYLLLARDFAPLEERLGNAASRLTKIPQLVEQAKANLDLPALVQTETAIHQNEGNLELIRGDLARAARGTALEARVEEAMGPAIAALEDFQGFLAGDLLARSGGSFRLGPDLYDRKLRLTCQSTLEPPDIRRRAWEEFHRVRKEMFDLACELYPRYFGSAAPPGSGVDYVNQIVGRVLGRIADDHPTEENILPFVQETLDRLESFIEEKDLLALDPGQVLKVEWMPAYSQGVAIAGLESPGPLERNLDAFYYVMPIPEDWTPEQADSFFREYNDWMVHILTIHEAMPGHFVQTYYANRCPSKVRSIFTSGTFVEGWAVYCERMMLDAGYMDSDPRLRLQQLKFYLRTVINAILDPEIHAGQMPEEMALDLMVNGGFQEMSEARGKWDRARLTSTQLSTYFVGLQEILDLRDRYREAKGSAFILKEFHADLLGHGSPPPRLLAEILFPGESQR